MKKSSRSISGIVKRFEYHRVVLKGQVNNYLTMTYNETKLAHLVPNKTLVNC
jgi:hypothetical protein